MSIEKGFDLAAFARKNPGCADQHFGMWLVEPMWLDEKIRAPIDCASC